MEVTKYRKEYAHKKVALAIKRGILKRGPCHLCGRTENGKVPMAAHHEDYFRPLDVIWLCARCHAAVHLLEPLFVPEAEKLE